jgi:hypothetical protein
LATLTSPSLGKLLTNVRNFLNQPNANNSFWSDAELSDYLNKAVSRYFVEIAHSDEGRFITKTSLNIVADTETVALPTDCFIVKAVRRKVTNGYAILNYRNEIDTSYSTQGGSGGDSYQPTYYFRANNLVLRPTPNFSETAGLEIEYMQLPEVLLNAGDLLTAQVVPIFKELIEAYAIYLAKEKESLVNGVNMQAGVMARVDSLYSSMKEIMTPRSMSPQFITPFDPEQ